MSSAIAPLNQTTRPGRRERRAEQRRLKHQDALSAHLAELHAIRALLGDAAEVVRAGWVQNAWFSIGSPDGRQAVTAYDLRLAEDRQITGACLVGAVVAAAGGPASVRTQLVQRTLDLVWHTLRENPDRPVRWCPGPRVRMMRVLELTHWNDAPTRKQGEVVGLLESARQATTVQRDLCRAEQESLSR